MMDQWRAFSPAPAAAFPATWTDGIEILLGNYVSPNFRLTLSGTTAVQVAASAGDGATTIAIRGKPRWAEATVGPVAHPGGSAGWYDIYATTGPDSFSTAPGPPPAETDLGDHSFSLRILPTSSAPSGSGSETYYRKVGGCLWDGSKIQAVFNTVGSFAGSVPTVTSLTQPLLTNAPAALLSAQGLTVDYQVDADTIWRLQRHASEAAVPGYPNGFWVFLGGPWYAPAGSYNANNFTPPSALSFTNGGQTYYYASDEAQIVAPLDGYYEIWHTAVMYPGSGSPGNRIAMINVANGGGDELQHWDSGNDMTQSETVYAFAAKGQSIIQGYSMAPAGSYAYQRGVAIRPRSVTA